MEIQAINCRPIYYGILMFLYFCLFRAADFLNDGIDAELKQVMRREGEFSDTMDAA